MSRDFSSQLNQIKFLLHGDSGAAKRLVHSAVERNPGKSAQWVLDKVLLDLQRDRR